MTIERSASRRVPVIAAGILIAMTGGLLLSACGASDVDYDYPERRGGTYRTEKYWEKQDAENTIWGSDGGFDLFGNSSKKAPQGGGGIGVNSYLWRASLDTIAFMPLASADPFGGVIITDWYTPPETPNERYKMSVYILGRELRGDGVKVAVFRQRQDNGSWVEAAVAKDTAINLENQILTRARQLRVASTQAR
jgi:hypothetical protein